MVNYSSLLKIFFLLISLIPYPFISFAKRNHDISLEKKNCFYVKTIINQPNLGYTRKLNTRWGLSHEVGYQFCILNEIHYTGAPLGIDQCFRNLGYKGFNFGIGPEFILNRSWNLNPFLGYSNLYAPKIIYDPGNFAGEDSEYDIYSQQVNEVNAKIIMTKNFRKAPIQFYIGQGVKFQFYYNAYSYEGRVNRYRPSNKTESGLNVIFNFLIIGLKFKFVQF